MTKSFSELRRPLVIKQAVIDLFRRHLAPGASYADVRKLIQACGEEAAATYCAREFKKWKWWIADYEKPQDARDHRVHFQPVAAGARHLGLQGDPWRIADGIVNLISYPGYKFYVRRMANGGAYLQVEFEASDAKTDSVVHMKSRKWLLSQHMTVNEVVQTALKAVLTVLEHEAREVFCYRGRAIYGAHFSPDRLWDLAGDPAALDERK